MVRAGRYGALLDALRGVRWMARRPAAAAVAGVHPSRMQGSSPELSEFRRYRQGDDPRRIDWKLLARSDRVYVRIANDRSILSTMLLLDASASMAFPAAGATKWDAARMLAVGLAAVAHAEGDPVGVAVSGGDSPAALAPRTRRGVVAEMARLLDGVAPSGAAPMAPLLVRRAGIPRVVIVSDFLGESDDTLRAGRELTAGGIEVHAVHVVAREELEPPSRSMLATDPENAALRRTLAPATRDGYIAAFAEWRDTLAREWGSAGASYTLVPGDEPADHAVRRIANPRAGIGGGVSAA